ncbi:2-keto-4-pentenoate hydratase/2-oxohepta-3-ene-1,7-dioic acid hydratase (catechol pathway) [Paramicrobacterium humi]|uniref:2-keto-4-pentenoate hydratase/2-oxohepta-3-ene-1,7-dioic acid hydratase (Catechol pathway) n=1 Tax=Paramicrobacterium humi TaxID=640635 RepID=A0A1H4LY29_9MICO|nr:fumarylacetoacetate hydrolase family protein [Microbacterium humi]SEB75488.1 2-keto-4-pentenoate hydratase/2-oxohepta-3-ene-1,7-dioic acid hydratase (catechol pathway) [Microbacterium humi]
MKFARLGPLGHEIPVVVTGSEQEPRYLDVSSITADIDGAFLSGDGVARARDAAAAGELSPVTDAASLRVGAAIARPSAIICIGMNYAAHAAESGSEPPSVPIIFLKTPNTIAGPNDTVTIPKNSAKTDWEVELGVVIGQRASYLDSPADSIRHIAGFVTANDLSEREFQLEVSGGQWSKGKSSAGFSPVGPWLVTPDEVDYNALRLRSWINGEPRQDSSTSDFIFDVDYVIWHLSQYLVLEPGDLIMTGTPEGVALSGTYPYLRPGDVCEIEIEGLGRQRQEFAAYSA